MKYRIHIHQLDSGYSTDFLVAYTSYTKFEIVEPKGYTFSPEFNSKNQAIAWWTLLGRKNHLYHAEEGLWRELTKGIDF